MIIFFLSSFFAKVLTLCLMILLVNILIDNRYKLYLHKLSNLMVIQSKKIVKL